MTRPSPGISFNFEWERGDNIVARELAATWARLEIWIGSDCVTELEDRDVGSARRSLYCSLYPLAEWAAYNWWFLRAHNRASALVSGTWASAYVGSTENGRGRSVRRHQLRGAGDGFLWPNLIVLPEGALTRLVWSADRTPSEAAPIRFLRQGEALLRAEWVELALSELIEAVLTRLDEQQVTASPLHEEWSAIVETTEEEREFCEAAAQLGFDPYDPPQELATQLATAGRRLGDAKLLRDFLDAVEPDLVHVGLDWIDDGTHLIQSTGNGSAASLDALRGQERGQASGSTRPWELGYAEAQRIRASLGLGDQQLFEVGGLVQVTESPYGGRGLQGLGGRSEAGSPALILGRGMRDGPKRFAGARALWHFVVEPDRDRFLITNAYTDRQRVERAFAAEVLAPASGIAEYLGDSGGMVTQSDVEDAADHFRVSPLLVQWQIQNQLAIGVST
jgi:hypothetical protein